MVGRRARRLGRSRGRVPRLGLVADRRVDASATRRLAHAEDASRTAAEALLLNAGVASLVAVAFTLVDAGRTHGLHRGALTGLAVVSVLIAWAVVHTVYTLRYARLYYAPPVGGIDFHEDDPPNTGDLAEMALTIGWPFPPPTPTPRESRPAAHGPPPPPPPPSLPGVLSPIR